MIKLDLAKAPPMPDPLSVLKFGGRNTTAAQFLDNMRTLLEQRAATEVIADGIMDAMANAITTIRAPIAKPTPGHRWDYKEIPDYPTRLLAMRLALAYLCGLPPSQTDVRIQTNQPGAQDGKRTPASMLEDLHTMGVRLHDVMNEFESMLPKQVSDID